MHARLMRPAARRFAPALGGALVALMIGTMSASAQWIGAPGGDGSAPAALPAPESSPAPAPAQPGPAPESFGAGMTPRPQQQANPDMADCQAQVGKLRGNLESRGETLEKAAKGKRPPSELCPLFRNFVTAQQSFLSYLTTNKSKCGVPDEALTQLKSNLSSVTSTRNKVCEVAKLQESGGGGAAPGGPPPQGQVSAGLGLPSGLPNMDSPKGGVFDTLGGDALR